MGKLSDKNRLLMDEGEDYGQEILVTMLSLKCALIAVNLILKDREEMDGMRVINDPYWLKVKNELEYQGIYDGDDR